MPKQYQSLTLADAKRMIAAAEMKAIGLNVAYNVAVVDAGGHLLAFVRQDGALIGSVELAINKAATARIFDKSTAVLSALAQPGKPLFGIQHSQAGKVLPANSIVSVSTLSMLRDPDVYANPDEFDIWRIDHVPRHPIFGGGAHRCLGESLARTELEEGLAVLSHRLPSLQMTGEPPVLLGHSGLRRVTPMRVTWSTGSLGARGTRDDR